LRRKFKDDCSLPVTPDELQKKVLFYRHMAVVALFLSEIGFAYYVDHAKDITAPDFF